MKLVGSKTEKNLLAAFAGESQARNRYTYFASVAKKAGYEQIAAIFLETSDNEKEHAKRFFNFLDGGLVEFTASFPAGRIGTTSENLKAAAEGEHEEWTKLYPGYAELARQEGFTEIASAFSYITQVEIKHELRYLKLLDNIKQGTVFKKENVAIWKCRNCGYHHESSTALEQCPACLHPKSFFELLVVNY